MDGSNWKRILLHWANQTGLFERTYFNVEQTDVEQFFERFSSRVTTQITKPNLVDFIKEHYPEVEIHLDDENNLSSSDYMYVYSLLLHYSCVKCPDPFFQQVCQTLPEQFQQAIASFFKILLEKENCSRETLRFAISSSSPKSPLRFLPLESPIRTPRSKISPPTPKTTMLEERTKELSLLKAQLESERYEKGCLELQMKQNEEKIMKFSQQQKTHLAEIYNLKNELLTKNTENLSPNKNAEEEQIKRRLRRDIAAKEEDILNLRENLETLNEEKSLIHDKLSYAENQVAICLEKIKEMDFVINELKIEIEKRDVAIQSLTETKNDLEFFINESRSSSQNRNDFNTSVECLDISLTRTSNSSGSVSSPENLGVAVVDIKLREKELENITLCDRIDRMTTDCKKLCKHVCELIVRYADTFDICNENLVVAEDADLTHTFMIFENYIEKMIESYTLSSRELKTITVENVEIHTQNASMAKQISELEEQLSNCNRQFAALQTEKFVLEQKNESCQEQLERYQDEVKRSKQQNDDLQAKLNELLKEYEVAKQTYNNNINQLDTEKMKIETQLTNLQLELEKLEAEKSQLNDEKKNNEEKMVQFSCKIKEKSSRIFELEDHNKNLLATVESHVHQICQSEEKRHELENIIAKLGTAVEALNEEKNTLLEEIETVRLDFSNVQNDLEKEKISYNDQIQVTNELRDEICRLKGLLDETDKQLQSKIRNIDELEINLTDSNKIIEELNKTISEMAQARDHLENCVDSLKEDFSATKVELAKCNASLAKTEKEYLIYRNEKEGELTNIKNELNRKVSNFENEMKDLNNKLARFQEEKKLLETEVNDKDKKLQSLNKNLANLKIQKADIEEQLAKENQDLQQNYNSLNVKTAEVKNEILSILRLSLRPGHQKDHFDSAEFENPIKYLKDTVGDFIATNTELAQSNKELQSIILELNTQITELKNSSEKLNGLCKSLAEEIAHSETKVETLQSENSALSTAIKESNKNLAESQEAKLELQQKQTDYEIKIDELNTRLNQLTSNNDVLLSDVSLLVTKENDLNRKAEKLQLEICDRIKNETNLKETILVTSKELADLREDHTNSQKLVAEKSDLVKNLTQKINILNKELEERLQLASEDDTKITSLRKESINLKNQINDFNSKFAAKETIEIDLKLCQEKQELMKIDLEAKRNSLHEAEIEISHLNEVKALLEASQKSLEQAATDREIKICDLEEAILNRDIKIKEFEGNLRDYESNVVELQGKVLNLESLIKEKDASLRECKESLDCAGLQNSNLREELVETTNDLQKQIHSFEKDKETLECTNKALQDNFSEIEESLKHAQTVNVELLSKIDELKTANSETTQRETDYINLQLKHVATCTEKEQISKSKQKLEETCTKLNKRLEKLAIKLGELQANASKLEKSNNESRCEINSLQKSLQQQKVRNEDLQNKLESAQRELKAANDKVVNLQGLYDAEVAKDLNLSEEMKAIRIRISEEIPALQRELKVSNEKSLSLQKLYNEEVAKAEALNVELSKELVQKESKQLELENQNVLLDKVKCDLEEKLETISKINTEFVAMKNTNEKLKEENHLLLEKVQFLTLAELKSKQAEYTFKTLGCEVTLLQKELEQLVGPLQSVEKKSSCIDSSEHEPETNVDHFLRVLKGISANLASVHVEKTALLKENAGLKCNISNLYEMVATTAIQTEENKKCISQDEDVECNFEYLEKRIKLLNSNKQNIENDCLRLSSDLEASREENLQLTDKVSKLSLKLEILQKRSLELENQVDELKCACDTLRSEKNSLVKENASNLKCVDELEAQQNEMLHRYVISENILKEQLENYEKQLAEKVQTIDTLEQELVEIRNSENSRTQEISSQTVELQVLAKKYDNLEQQVKKEREQSEKLKKDIAIFQAKLFKNRQMSEENEKQWKEEREKLTQEMKTAEERIKDNRLELEGKLEKMKNKMKTLYNEEVTKIKNKHEREIVEYKTKVEGLLAKNEKYEAHVQKLAKHVFNLNESILELQKQNKFMETKLKDFESIPTSTLRRQSQFTSQMLGSNLRMEDEEGELFNNTYLADLKNGRMSPFGRESVSVNELHYRNSLAPPHLRSTYIAQYPDHHLREEDIKDVPINLDDSLSSLLHAGQRKKVSGTTSYKRPGPPTPSKNGGRLSFGSIGSCDPPREILKESNDFSISNAKRGTPSKFRTMFSSYKMKDELLTLVLDRSAIHRKRRKSLMRNQQITSTPRKSRFDQRRHLEERLMGNGDTEDQCTPNDSVNLFPIGKKDLITEKFTKWRQSALPSTDSCTTSDSNSPHCVAEKDDSVFVETVQKVSIHKRKDRRTSFMMRGNMFAKRKHSAHSVSVREQIRNRAKHQRALYFNKYRKSLTNDNIIKLRHSLLGRLSSIRASPANNRESYNVQDRDWDSAQWRPSSEASKNFAGVDGNAEMFESLLTAKESNAPFEVSELNLTSTSVSRQTSLKTLYSGSVIKNRKLPHVKRTVVEDTSSILSDNRITIFHIFRNWQKLDLCVKTILVICFFILVFNIMLGLRHLG